MGKYAKQAAVTGGDDSLETSRSTSNFIRQIIEEDLATNKHAHRRWNGQPGPLAIQTNAPLDPAKIRTRFPPEPNGYLHIGHAKSIFLNFGLAKEYGGVCHLRFDDTNPEKEEQEYVDSIQASMRWLGFEWQPHLYFASDYFAWMYAFAEDLVRHGYAYVDSLPAEEIRAYRGTLTEPGKESPYRARSIEENLALLQQMKNGEFPDGAHVLRAKIDMGSANINLRDPIIYRIRHIHHHRTADQWCIYPMYDYAHCISDALENITHSICTLEFSDHRPLYDWILERLAELGRLQRPLPRQIEFARLNLTYVVLSKRKLIELVTKGYVSGWDDPRMPTIVGARRRGYTPEGFRRFTERIGVAKADSWIDYSILEESMREHLNETAERRIAVLKPLKLIIDNYPEAQEEECWAPNHPQKPELGKRMLPFSRELWIEADDFAEVPPAGYFRLYPGNQVRLRYGYVVQCTGCEKNDRGEVIAVHADYFPDSKSGTEGTNRYKVKGNIHWLSAKHAFATEVRLYDRLFKAPIPGAKPLKGTVAVALDGEGKVVEETAGGDYLEDLNPHSQQVLTAYLEAALQKAQPEERFQFERHGYFVVDYVDTQPSQPIFNKTVGLKDSWGS